MARDLRSETKELGDLPLGSDYGHGWFWYLRTSSCFCPRHVGPCTAPLPDPSKASGPFHVSPGKGVGSWELGPSEGGTPRTHLLLSGP